MRAGHIKRKDILELDDWHHPNNHGNRQRLAPVPKKSYPSMHSALGALSSERCTVCAAGSHHLAAILAAFLESVADLPRSLPTYSPTVRSTFADRLRSLWPPSFRSTRAHQAARTAAPPNAPPLHSHAVERRPFPHCELARPGGWYAQKQGWAWVESRKYFNARFPNATLHIPIHCVADGCGVLLGISRSYLPLGMLRIWVWRRQRPTHIAQLHRTQCTN